MNQTVSDYRFKFSVVTAVYNVEPYLAEAIESILAQDIGFEESVEIILIDDGSTDRSGAICDEYQQKFPDNIKVIHKENGGAASARNIGISHCEGQYISFMDADDRLTSSTLSDVYGFFSTCDANIPFVSVPIYFFEKEISVTVSITNTNAKIPVSLILPMNIHLFKCLPLLRFSDTKSFRIVPLTRL